MKPEHFEIGLRVTGKDIEGYSVGFAFAPAYIVGATHQPGRFSKKTIRYVVVRQEAARKLDGGTIGKPEYRICKFENIKAVEK
ncbi:hypothetical protein [Streptomyces werraensis]|uniref:hypothetical protein n=1 Tax=Streptomyces werraensis TaxID=68284 RepID=UPI0036F8641D